MHVVAWASQVFVLDFIVKTDEQSTALASNPASPVFSGTSARSDVVCSRFVTCHAKVSGYLTLQQTNIPA